MRLLIAGLPGSGKGTQSLRLARALMIPHVSTGDLLREAIRRATPLGLSISECVAAGRLVPDVFVNELVHARLEKPDARRRGFLLDGFPRNLDQFEGLVRWLRPDALDAAIELAVSNEVARERLAKRGRTDDTTPGVRERFHAFERETSPLLRRLEREGLLLSVDADRAIDDITHELLRALRTPQRRAVSPAGP
jgi:adenylate kinase